MMKAALYALAILIAAPAFAHAQQDCGDLASQAEMNICADHAFKKSDAELNAAYKQIEGRLSDDPASKKLLVASQRAWVAFRDAECTFASSGVAGGSMQPFIQSSCLEDLTKKRVTDLKGYLSCEEGDTSCPVPAGN